MRERDRERSDVLEHAPAAEEAREVRRDLRAAREPAAERIHAQANGRTWIPAPTSEMACTCSYTVTSRKPTRLNATAAASPPMPAPMMAMRRSGSAA
jgi:hypothetical protein